MEKISAGFLQDEGASALLDGARGVIAALHAVGEDVRFIGGCVRDAVLGLNSADIDLATTALPEKVMQVLPVTGFTVRDVGAAHGVVLAWRDGHKYEVATLREDVVTDGRHAVVAFTRDWELDARRRDFTINALSADADGKVYDYVGGLPDLRARRVRFIGEAATRVREDYLRILRFYRFHARFGDVWDTDSRAACRDGCAGLLKISRERVTEELQKLLSLENPQEKILPAYAAMDEDQVFAEVVPQLNDIIALKKLLAREKIYGHQNWLLHLAAWGGLARHFDEAFLDQFVFTRTGRADVKMFATLDYQKLNHALYHHGAAAVRAAVMLRADDAELPQLMAQIENFTPREFPLQAEDLLQMGVEPGPRLGEILREVEDWWLKGERIADKAACLKKAQEMISS